MVESLTSKVKAWELERKVPFLYYKVTQDFSLLSILTINCLSNFPSLSRFCNAGSPLTYLGGIYRVKTGEGRGEASISGMFYIFYSLSMPKFSIPASPVNLSSTSKLIWLGLWRVSIQIYRSSEMKNMDQDVQLLL